MHLARIIKNNYSLFWNIVFLGCLFPLLILIWEYKTDNLGVNKLETLTNQTGIWALNFLFLSLAITPGRRWLASLMIKIKSSYGKRIGDWNFLVRMRRMIGLYSFFYACLHALLFIWLDQGFEWKWIIKEMQEKPYLFVGFIAFILLIPLAITSTNAAMRYLGKNWRRLHKMVYGIGILVTLHYLLLSKAGEYNAKYYAVLLIILLGDRVLHHYSTRISWAKDDGMEVAER